MAVNETFSNYSTTASSNTPSGSDNIGTDLDDHLRDIKRQITRAATHFRSRTAPESVTGLMWYDSSGTASDSVTEIKFRALGQWIGLFRIDESAGVAYALADPSLYPSAGVVLTAGNGLSGGGTLVADRSFSLANFTSTVSATATWSIAGATIKTDPYGRVMSATNGHSPATNAEVEDRSSTAVYVTPVTTHQHPGVAKFWVAFDGSGTASVTQSYNIASVVRSAAGTYTINFTTGFSNTGYALVPECGISTGGNTLLQRIGAKATTSCQILFVTTGGVASDVSIATCVGFGYHTT